MTTARQLYALQELDLALDQIDGQKAGAEAELDSGKDMAQIESALHAETERLRELQSTLRVQQMEAESQRERSAQLDSQLYGGALTNPRDLESLEQEASRARDLLQEWDAQLLELSVNEEEARVRCQALEKELAETHAAWELRSAELKENLGRLNADRESIGGKRSSLAATLESSAMQRYDSLRRTKGGVAVAKVERGLCQGCRMALPTQQQQRVRNGRQTVLCSSCGRILFLS
jgi:predicted  nucleic acid-binding Zn-ribbon protein